MKNKKLWVSIIAGLLAFLMVFGLIASLIPTASAASSSEIKKQIEEMKDQQSELEKQKEELKSQQSENLSEIEQIVEQKNNIDQQVGILYEQVTIINQQIAAYNVLIADKQTELDEAEAKLAELTEQNKERIRTMEEDGTLSYWSVLFQANSFSDLLDRLSMIEEIAAADQRRLTELSAAANAVAEAKESLTAERAELETTKAELDAAQAELDAASAESDALLEQLLAQGEEMEALMAEYEDREEELLLSLLEKEEELDEAKKAEYQQWLSTSVPPTTQAATTPSKDTNVPSSSGWIKPCAYRKVTSPYGWRIHPVYGYKKFHYGIDLANAKGTPIYAVKSGTVTAAYYDSEGGYMVKINHHDGFTTSYLHLTNYTVKKGDIVSQGQVIGYMGSTGTSTGSHLHFAMTYNGEYVNPADYINF